jgi:Rieske Fe-S protein
VADVTITPANVISTATTVMKSGFAGAAVTAGQVVYLDPADGKIKPALATADTTSKAEGIALNGAAVGQPVWYATEGPVNLGSVLVVGKLYVVSGVGAGSIAPSTDLAAGWRTSVVGYAATSSQLVLTRHNTLVVN